MKAAVFCSGQHPKRALVEVALRAICRWRAEYSTHRKGVMNGAALVAEPDVKATRHITNGVLT